MMQAPASAGPHRRRRQRESSGPHLAVGDAGVHEGALSPQEQQQLTFDRLLGWISIPLNLWYAIKLAPQMSAGHVAQMVRESCPCMRVGRRLHARLPLLCMLTLALCLPPPRSGSSLQVRRGWQLRAAPPLRPRRRWQLPAVHLALWLLQLTPHAGGALALPAPRSGALHVPVGWPLAALLPAAPHPAASSGPPKRLFHPSRVVSRGVRRHHSSARGHERAAPGRLPHRPHAVSGEPG